MRVRAYILLGILFLLCLALDALTFGALAREPVIGPAVAASARAEAPLAHTYIVLGMPLVDALAALQSIGRNCAETAFGGAYPAIAETPAAAIDLLFSASRGAPRALFMLFYWGAPSLLVLTIVAWLFRTRPTHLIKTARR
ncbi:MAG: hypothetical protein ABIY40_05060 [Rhodanobacteraceae bacterium]